MNTPALTYRQWTNQQALVLMVLCLSIGICGGWLISNVRQPAPIPVSKASAASAPAVESKPAQQPDLKSMADSKAAPLLQRLKADPKNPDLLTNLGNLYYDAQQYSSAVDFYQRALQSKPSDVAVRTDMATAYWYLGN